MEQVKRDYYEILGVRREAEKDELRRAFRSRARELHPDVSADPEAKRKFTELAEAYQVLSKPTKRLLYDHYGYRGWGNGGLPAEGTDARHLRRRPATTAEAELEVEAFEAARGTTRTVHLSFVASCPSCRGEGAEPGTPSEPCPDCRGDGRVKRSSTSESGRLLQIETCAGCAGTGRVISRPCSECAGAGRVKLDRAVEVEIPRGSRDGQTIRLPEDGPVGETSLTLRVRPVADLAFVRHAASAGLVIALGSLIALLLLS